MKHKTSFLIVIVALLQFILVPLRAAENKTADPSTVMLAGSIPVPCSS